MAEECEHPDRRASRWEQETGGCLDCHAESRRHHTGPLLWLALGVLTSGFLSTVAAFAAARRAAPIRVIIGSLLFPVAVILMFQSWRWHLNRIRWHTPPPDPNREARWTGSSWSQT